MSTRNYLFAANENDVALTRLLATAARVTGFLKGAPGGALPFWYGAGADNVEFIRTLHARLAASYPAAGPAFHAVRLFTNLTWQPAYLAVIGAHVHGAVPDLAGLSQARQNLDVDGFRLEARPQYRAVLPAMIAQAGGQVRQLAETAFAEINQVTRLKPVPAQRLLAARMLGLMTRLPAMMAGISLADQHRFSALWLEATGLTGQGRLETATHDDGRQFAIIARKGCCLDYLAFPDRYCSDCPKQGATLLRARQLANALAEDDARRD